jgi:hypothetical protein
MSKVIINLQQFVLWTTFKPNTKKLPQVYSMMPWVFQANNPKMIHQHLLLDLGFNIGKFVQDDKIF